ncbi:hypothetical protein [Planctomyces sp. SH-PL62]|uniref:hypothetical protein n=1 Tax=Planctomyces sp. SH-PL62 TaxID=1636152 RepID=UPI00078DFD00|nr:hypothetical protein [Planctomyces sp. SH-PL62]AMV37223.1 hypothetical protein VT85_07310 [Planctomyces sp. SH-PL62]
MKTPVRGSRGRWRSTLRVAGLVGLGWLPLGCGWWSDEIPSLVWGQVVARGKPLTQGTVILMPLAEDTTTWGIGALDSTGRFELISSRFDIPIQPGRYAVYIRPPIYTDPETMKIMPPPGYAVPPRFLDPESTDITIDLKAAEPTRLDLTLQD